jgi:hypothetical protein
MSDRTALDSCQRNRLNACLLIDRINTDIATRARPVFRAMPKHPARPLCPRCGIRMFGTSSGGKKDHECLRCGHVEAREEQK